MNGDGSRSPIALVVGAGDYLGSAIAKRFARENYPVVATRRRGEYAGLIEEIEAVSTREPFPQWFENRPDTQHSEFGG